jgi:hypothetical protein
MRQLGIVPYSLWSPELKAELAETAAVTLPDSKEGHWGLKEASTRTVASEI